MKYTMSELANKSEVSARTIRYWISEQLIPSPKGSGHGAFYTDEHLEAICRVKKMKDEGVTLAAIKNMDGCPDAQTFPTKRLSHVSPFPGVDLLIDDEVSPHYRRIFIQAVTNAARSLQTDKQGVKK